MNIENKIETINKQYEVVISTRGISQIQKEFKTLLSLVITTNSNVINKKDGKLWYPFLVDIYTKIQSIMNTLEKLSVLKYKDIKQNKNLH